MSSSTPPERATAPSTAPSDDPPAPARPGPLRYIVVVLGLLAIVGALAAIKGKQIGQLIAFGKEAEKAGPPPESVASAQAQVSNWDDTIQAVGSVEAGKGVSLTNDAPGVVTTIRFDSGAKVKQGDVLVELDTRVEKAQLASALARRDLATTTADRTRTLVESSAVAPAQLDADESARRAATADVATLQAQLARKVVRAPFAGTLGIRTVNLGQYLNPGTSLTTLQSTDEEFVDFTLPQQRLAQVKVGTAVRLTLDGDKANPLDGEIAAVEPQVDPTTRAVRLRARPKSGKGRLRPGMFVEVTVVLPVARRVVNVPVTSVVRASFGDSVFVIEPGQGPQAGKQVARQQFVQAGETRGNFVAIDKGLAGTETLVSSGAFKLRNGATVTIDNSVAPAASATPKPEDR